MDKPLRQRLQRMIGVEEEGRITPKELADYIARCAIEPGFFDHLDLFSPEVIAYLRDRALHAAPHPEDSLAFSRVLVRGKFDNEAHERETREVYYWAARRLREHFYPDLPLPEFEPIRLAGVVTDSLELHGHTFVFGVERSYLIRKHPIHLVDSNGLRTVTSVVREEFIKTPQDAESSDPLIRRFGRAGLGLETHIKPADTPPGTEVWVDRTAVAELPDTPFQE